MEKFKISVLFFQEKKFQRKIQEPFPSRTLLKIQETFINFNLSGKKLYKISVRKIQEQLLRKSHQIFENLGAITARTHKIFQEHRSLHPRTGRFFQEIEILFSRSIGHSQEQIYFSRKEKIQPNRYINPGLRRKRTDPFLQNQKGFRADVLYFLAVGWT